MARRSLQALFLAGAVIAGIAVLTATALKMLSIDFSNLDVSDKYEDF